MRELAQLGGIVADLRRFVTNVRNWLVDDERPAAEDFDLPSVTDDGEGTNCEQS
jgi:hypothetical protein